MPNRSKKKFLLSLRTKLEKHFNISIAETDENHLWQKTFLGIASVANEPERVSQTLDQVITEIRTNPRFNSYDIRLS